MSTGHTPGPWHLDWVIDGAFHVIAQVQGDECVIASRAPFPARHLEFAANARLIAAAPELLATLRQIVDNRAAAERGDEVILGLPCRKCGVPFGVLAGAPMNDTDLCEDCQINAAIQSATGA